MIREAIGIGETDEIAKENALKQLGIEATNDVRFEIIKKAEKKKFGLFGGSPAKVKAIIEIPDDEIEESSVVEGSEVKEKVADEFIDDVLTDNEVEIEETVSVDVVNDVVYEVKEEISISEKEVPADYNPAKEAKEYVERILSAMGLNEIEVSITETEDSAEINLSGNQVGAVIGRRGETLDALQYLAGLVANHVGNTYYRVTINTGNYREKREKTLEVLGRKLAFKVLKTGRNVSLEPMNPYERRIIHTSVQKVNGAISWSEGEVTNRHVVIGLDPEYKRPYRKPYNNNRNGGRKYNNGYDKKRNYNGNKRYNNNRSNENGTTQTEREPKNEGGSYSLYGRVDTQK